MTKKDYILIIKTIKVAYQDSLNIFPNEKGFINLNDLMHSFIHNLNNDNDRFNQNKFIKVWQEAILPLNKTV